MDINNSPYSNLKIFNHPQIIESLKEGKRIAPLYIRIKPTNLCNQNCYYCHYGKGKYLELEGQDSRNQIPWNKMQEIINDLGDIGVKAVTFSGGGEPLVYPKIVETMKLALQRNIHISIITNGQLLKDDKAEVLTQAKWVRISLDSANEETYARTRGISLNVFKEVCLNIKNFACIKPAECELGINFVVNHENADQVYEAGKLMHDLGVNHIKFSARMTNNVEAYHEPFKSKVIEQISRLRDDFQSVGFKVINLYETDFDHCSVFQRNYSRCFINEIATVIAADCKVYYCHDKAYLHNGIIGDISDQKFSNMWFSEEVTDKLRNFDASKECNHHCVYDDRNILLNNFFNLDQNHINFI